MICLKIGEVIGMGSKTGIKGVVMQKSVITKDQAEAIEMYKKVDTNREILNDYFGDWNVSHWSRIAIRQMDIDDLIAALYIGYEVEPEFKVGNLVIFEHNEVIRVIGEIVETITEDDINYAKVNDPKYPVPQLVLVSRLRHATPEEIKQEKELRWWKKHNRDVWELKQGDILICGGYTRVVDKVVDFNEKSVLFIDNDWEYYENVIDEYKVASFNENRLDVKPNE